MKNSKKKDLLTSCYRSREKQMIKINTQTTPRKAYFFKPEMSFIYIRGAKTTKITKQ